MKNIFELTKREQRIVILIVVALVAFAFGKHLFETKSSSSRTVTSSYEEEASTTPPASLNEEEAESPSPQSSP